MIIKTVVHKETPYIQPTLLIIPNNKNIELIVYPKDIKIVINFKNRIKSFLQFDSIVSF